MKRRPVLKPNVWNVPAFKHTVAALTACRELGSGRRPLGLITAPAGDGKTFAAEWYLQSQKPGSVRHAFCPPKSILNTRSLLERLFEACGKTACSVRNSSLFDELAIWLRSEHAFLIVDEADRLRSAEVDLLRELAEVSGVALCLMGCPGILATLERVPAARHRIGFWFQVPPVCEQDLQKVLSGQFEASVIDAIFSHTHGNLRHVEALIESLGLIDNTSGATVIDADTVAIIATECLMGAA
jgi:hypothetical protein